MRLLIGWSPGVTATVPLGLRAGVEAISLLFLDRSLPVAVVNFLVVIANPGAISLLLQAQSSPGIGKGNPFSFAVPVPLGPCAGDWVIALLLQDQLLSGVIGAFRFSIVSR